MKYLFAIMIGFFISYALPEYSRRSIENDATKSTVFLVGKRIISNYVFIKEDLFKFVFINSTPIPFINKIKKFENIKSEGGSGLIIKNNNKKFILTNKHVCLSFKNKKNAFVLSDIKEVNNYKEENVKYSKFFDLCTIPYKGDLPAFKVTKDDWRRKVLEYYSIENKNINYKRNHFSNGIHSGGKIIKEDVLSESLYFYQHNENTTGFPAIKVGLKPIHGDSGSPIISTYGDLHSIVFAIQTNQKDVSGMFNAQNRKEKVKFIQNGFSISGFHVNEFLKE